MCDQRTDQRIRDRGGEDAMPSLEHLVAVEAAVEERRDADLLAAFGKAKSSSGPVEPPDLLAAFSRAAKDREDGDEAGGSESGLDRARPPAWPGSGPDSGRSRER
jgi:hypothetical protein